MSIFVLGFAALAFGLLALDRLIAWILPLVTPYMPADICGPEGWLIDTQGGTGIFDRARR